MEESSSAVTANNDQHPPAPSTSQHPRSPRTISRVDVLRRRSFHARQEIRFLRNCHWAFLEKLRIRLRDYYWRFGSDPRDLNVDPPSLSLCVFPGCKSKAMESTSYCHQHILSDPNQCLYKACSYVIKSGAAGPVICWKPVPRSVNPPLCPIHFQKVQRHMSQALKKAGSNVSSLNKPAPKFHVIISEYIHQIQRRRRDGKKVAFNVSKNKGKHVG